MGRGVLGDFLAWIRRGVARHVRRLLGSVKRWCTKYSAILEISQGGEGVKLGECLKNVIAHYGR